MPQATGWIRAGVTASLGVLLYACSGSSMSPSDTYQPPILQETLSGSISAKTSPQCSNAFVRSVHPSYYALGTNRCVEFRATSETAGMVKASLRWPDWHVDLDLVLNDGVDTNLPQGLGGNKSGERIEAFVNAGTTYVFIVH